MVGALLAFRTMFSLSKEVMTVLSGTLVVTIGLVLKDQASSVLAGIMLLIEKPFELETVSPLEGTMEKFAALDFGRFA